MGFIIPVVLLLASTPTAPRYEGATEVYHCTFDESHDVNYDGWPDAWTRRQGNGYPGYLKIEIVDQPSPDSQRSLRVGIDGGAAAVYTNPIHVSWMFGYVVEVWVRTEQLNYDSVYLSANIVDARRRPLETFHSARVTKTDGWQRLRLGPFEFDHEDAEGLVIGLHVEPSGQRYDLDGEALFGGVWLGRVPRVTLSLAQPRHVYLDPENVQVQCRVAGIDRRTDSIAMQARDVRGTMVRKATLPLELEPAFTHGEVSLDPTVRDHPPMLGTVRWNADLAEPGYYRIEAALESPDGAVHRRHVALAVIRSVPVPEGGEFGWSFSRHPELVSLREVGFLASNSAVSWIKLPVWIDDQTPPEDSEALAELIARLVAQGVYVTGTLCEPPPSVLESFGRTAPPLAAETFSADPEIWQPSVELTATRFGTQINWWQVGADGDTSFVGYPYVDERVARVKDVIDKAVYDVRLGMPWDWQTIVPEADDPPWRFLTYSAQPPLTPEELATYLPKARQAAEKTWIALKPLPRDAYSLDVRVADLVERMMTAKIHQADAVFLPDPIDDLQGLFLADGTPTELYLPWRTTAAILSGTEYVGSIRLPGGSENRIFCKGGRSVMVLWNQEDTVEELHLGDDIREVDVWGRVRAVDSVDGRQRIAVERLPTFIIGGEVPLVRWRQSCHLERERIPSVYGRPFLNELVFENTFDHGVSGSAMVVAPSGWRIEPPVIRFKLTEKETMQQPIMLTLPYDASSGRQPVRIDFVVRADRTYRFSVFRHLDVGLGDVYLEFTTRLNGDGELEVEQHFVNETDEPVSFRCELFAPGRRRLSTTLSELETGRRVTVYRLPDGKELLGKTLWLRAEEIGGPRALNYRLRAAP